MSKLISKNKSKTNISNIKLKSQSKIISNQKITFLKKILKPEIREVKGKDYTDAYIRILEKQYEHIIDDSLNNQKILNSIKNNQLFQKVLKKIDKKNKNKIIIRNKSQRDISSTNRSLTGTKFLNSSKTLSNKHSPIKNNNNKNISKAKSKKYINNSNSDCKSTYWEDYDFLKKNHITGKKINKKNLEEEEENCNIIKEITEKNSLEEQNSEQKNNIKYNNNKIIDNDNDNLEKYYLYLLNKRKKNNENITNEEKKNDKNNMDIMRKIMEYLYDDDSYLKKNLEDKTIPNFCKRFMIQDEIRKENLLEKAFLLNYNESQKLNGPKLSNGSRMICNNIINYEPIDKRLNKIIEKKKNDIEAIKNDIEKDKTICKSSRGSWKRTEEWLINMDKWNKNKLLKIKQKKEEIDRINLYCSKCSFKPIINKNAHLKKEDEGIIFSDRLYSEYFTLRQKIEDKIEKQQSNFTFRPKINKIVK